MAEVSLRPLKGGLRLGGRGKFLIPGLIDTHTHLGQVPGTQLAQRAAQPDIVARAEAQEPRSYLYFGFTTVLSLGDTAPPVARWNAVAVRPDAYFCGATPMVDGYAFQGFGGSPYFLFNAEQAETLPASVDKAQHTAEALVQQMSRDGAVCVKSYRESGFGRDAGRLPVPSVDTIRALVAAAHTRGMPVFLHANSMAAQQCAVEAGVDVIAHGMWNGHRSTPGVLDEGVEPILQEIVKRGIACQPTAQVIRGLAAELDDRFLADPLPQRVYPPELLAWYRSPEGSWFRDQELGGTPASVFERIGAAGDAVTAYLARSRARLLFGTDTPNEPVYANPPGRAHLLVLRADPLDDVEAYNTIETVFLAGKAIPRETLAAAPRS